MPPPAEELQCRRFQPNVFDSSRCHACLRLRHLHHEAESEDWESLSADSSGGDASAESLCVLSPQCELYVCDGSDDTDSIPPVRAQDPRGHRRLAAAGQEEELHPVYAMTRLDPALHRPNSQAWMEETRRRDGFSRSAAGPGGQRDRDSGYHSLGRATGIRSLREPSPPPPYRHMELGRALPSNHSPERKAAIPFRNPDLGRASERRSTEVYGAESPPPQSLDCHGQRSLSPTPFKQAESLGPAPRKGYDRQQSSLSQRQGSTFSRSSSPSRSPTAFRQTDFSSSSLRRNVDSSGFSRGSTPDLRGSYGRGSDVAGTSKNFKSIANTVSSRSQSGSFTPNSHPKTKAAVNSDSRSSSPSRRGYDQSTLRKSDVKPSANGYANESRSSSPMRRGYDSPRQALQHKSETKPPSNGYGRDSRQPSPCRIGYEVASQARLRNSDTHGSSHAWKGGEPLSQSQYRKTDSSRFSTSRSASPSRQDYHTSSHLGTRRTEGGSALTGRVRDSRSPSPSRRGYDTPTPLSKTKQSLHNSASSLHSRNSSPSRSSYSTRQTPLRKTTNYSDQKRSNPNHANPAPSSSRGSTHSLYKTAVSRSSSPSGRRSVEPQIPAYSHGSQTTKMGRGQDLNTAPEYQSPSAHMGHHTSSQSSMESESSHVSASLGLNREEYALMADLPKVKTIYDREGPGKFNKPSREELYKPASHSQTKDGYRDWDSLGERGRASGRENEQKPRQEREGGTLSRTQSSTSLHTQRSSSPIPEEGNHWKVQLRQRSERGYTQEPDRPAGNIYPGQQAEPGRGSTAEKPDLLNFKKGWMSKLDENGEWKKHWFVLTDASLRYYRDSGAEENDDLDGEIDLRSCLKVSEFDVEKNYGFQIQTQSAVVTLSAMTSGIRRNWIEVLRKTIRPVSSPDITRLPDSEKEISHVRHPSLRQSLLDARSDVTAATSRRFDYVELAPVSAQSSAPLARTREAGEGQSKDQGAQPTSEHRRRIEEEIEKKWAEIEKLPLKEMRMLPAIGCWADQPANEALQREVASLRQQLQKGGGGGGGRAGRCGPEAPCGRSLEAMERAHAQALLELQRQHEREMRELQKEKEKLLQEETQATAQAMEVLKKAHREEMTRELERVRGHVRGDADTEAIQRQQKLAQQSLQRELDGLSERYSQKCLELNRAVQSCGEREREISQRERDMEQLRKENVELQQRLTEEIAQMRNFITGQSSERGSHDNEQRDSCELEMLLRVKDNEVQYLHKEIGCLRDELQSLNSEKRSACQRYRDVCSELSGMKSRSEREIEGLREHLRLAMAALQEGQRLGNSLEH